MAGGAHYAEGEGADLDLVALVVEFAALRQRKFHALASGGEIGVLGVDVYRGAGLFHNRQHRAHMVVVTVGYEYDPAFQVIVLNIVKYGVGLVAGVDDGAFQRFLVCDDVAVGFKLTYGYGFDVHGGLLKARLCQE